jgi:nitrite reductase/ring-hydroxylating ferredoxin subunit
MRDDGGRVGRDTQNRRCEMARAVRVAEASEIPEGQGISVEVEGEAIAVFNVDGEFRAMAATCSHHRAPLARGVIAEGQLHCPWHGAAFDVDTGVCSAFPAGPAAATYAVKIEAGQVFIIK